jgi:hypothetical protein
MPVGGNHGRKPPNPTKVTPIHGKKPPMPRNKPGQHGRKPPPPPPRTGRNMGKSSSSAGSPRIELLAYGLLIVPLGALSAIGWYLARGHGIL